MLTRHVTLWPWPSPFWPWKFVIHGDWRVTLTTLPPSIQTLCLPSFTVIFSNICTAHAQTRLFMNFRCKFRHRRSIRQLRFPVRVQNIGELATFSVDFLHFIFWMSAIFLLPVCLTYWPRKYTTGVDPQVDNSHQVWSWYDNPMPSYSVFVWWHVTWPCDIDLRPFDLEQLQYITGHVF